MVACMSLKIQTCTKDTDGLHYIHCDVFSPTPYNGNSLAVFPDSGDLTAAQMLRITQELRHFESVFLTASGTTGEFAARFFDLNEELPFAGHPIIGAACVLHAQNGGSEGDRKTWLFELAGKRIVQIRTVKHDRMFKGILDQGRPEIVAVVPREKRAVFARAFCLKEDDLVPGLPLEIISTGLKYLIIPVGRRMETAKITAPNLEDLLSEQGADYAYLFDPFKFEGRHWNNDGIVEDVATGSAAGVVGAYALRHGLTEPGEIFDLKQGHYMGRPSEIGVRAFGSRKDVSNVEISGDVSIVGTGKLFALPE